MKSRKLFNRIAALRVERGVTRRELAEKIGVNFQTVGCLERKKYNPILDLPFRISESSDLRLSSSSPPRK